MSTEPARGSRPIDFANLGCGYWFTAVVVTLVVVGLWFADSVGPGHPVYTLVVTWWTFILTPGVALPALRGVPRRWFRVSPRERLLHQMLGVGAFGRLLDRSGYNRQFVYPMWKFPNTKSGLAERAQSARGGIAAHGVCFLIHVLVAGSALVAGHAWGAAWILVPGVILHLYPVLLQRAILLRLQPMLDKSARLGN